MSLINPNQTRHCGFVVSDDPTDRTRAFGITGDDIHIPFLMQGTTVYFESHVPTAWEFDNRRTLALTIDAPWNPGKINMSIMSVT